MYTFKILATIYQELSVDVYLHKPPKMIVYFTPTHPKWVSEEEKNMAVAV